MKRCQGFIEAILRCFEAIHPIPEFPLDYPVTHGVFYPAGMVCLEPCSQALLIDDSFDYSKQDIGDIWGL